MAAKTTTVNIRVDAERKARWQEAAGGPRRLSAWLTELADAASSPDAAETLTALGAQAKLAEAALPLVTPVIPTLPKVVEQEASAGQCPRWMHHRKGVYCGTCKKVN